MSRHQPFYHKQTFSFVRNEKKIAMEASSYLLKLVWHEDFGTFVLFATFCVNF